MAMHSDDDYMVTEEASVGYQKRTLIDHVNLHVKKGDSYPDRTKRRGQIDDSEKYHPAVIPDCRNSQH